VAHHPLERDSDDIGGLADLPGPKAVRDQLAERIAVLQAEQARRNIAACGASRELIGLLGAFGLGPQVIDRAVPSLPNAAASSPWRSENSAERNSKP